MYIIAALGNYGEKYATTRHNAGWLILDAMLGDDIIWGHNKYARADYLNDVIGEIPIEYIKPHTMMNLSGQSVASVVKKLDSQPSQVIVIHDDMAIPMGDIKISYNRGSGEHNGVESITQALGTQKYVRVRIGIGARGLVPLKSYVLMQFSDEELGQIKELAPTLQKALKLIVTKGVEQAMNEMN
jgi:PTH1 family peptidyl-tRNA hydrolase